MTGNSSIAFNTVTHVTITVNTTGGITTFGGADDNDSMALVVDAGTVDLSKASNSGTHVVGSGLTINTGGTVQIDGNPTSGAIDQQIYEGSNVNINGGTLDLNGRNEGMPQLNGNSTGTITNTADSPATLTLGEGDGGTYSGLISDGNGGVAVAHIGTGTSILNGTGTFTGGLTVLSGMIQFGTSSSLGNGNVTVGDSGNTGLSATLDFNSSTGSDGGIITNPIFSTGNGTNEITAVNWNPTFSGPIALSNDLILNSNNGNGSNIFFTGNVTGTGNLTLQVLQNNGNSSVQLSGASINNIGNITNNGTGVGSATISGNIGSNVINVIQNSATSQLTLSGNNTFGSLTILSGNVNLNSNGASGWGILRLAMPPIPASPRL